MKKNTDKKTIMKSKICKWFLGSIAFILIAVFLLGIASCIVEQKEMEKEIKQQISQNKDS